MGILQYLLTKPQPVSFHWVDIPLNISINPSPSICQLGVYSWVCVNQALASIFQRKKAGTYLFIYLLPNKTQDHQPTWEIPEPEETQPNLSGLSEEVDGYKKPLLVPRLQFFVELKQRQEVHSGSLLHGRRKTVDFSFFKKAQCESCKPSFIWSKIKTIAQEQFLRGVWNAPSLAISSYSTPNKS